MNEGETEREKGDVKIVRNVVFLFKAQKETEEDRFVNSLESAGFNPVSVPVLSFEYLNEDVLSECLSKVDDYSALVLTSTKAVDAINISLKTLCKDLRRVTCYVVGKSTGDAARSIGLDPRGEDSGNATELCKLIVEELQPSYTEDKRLGEKMKPVLYPCSSIRRDTLRASLLENNIPVEEVCVYNTCKNKRLEESLLESISIKGYPEFVVFFSPSGVKFTSPLITSGSLPLEKMKVVAIGPTTASELRDQDITIYGVADKPDPESLIEILNRAKSS